MKKETLIELLSLAMDGKDSTMPPVKVGEAYYFRTVTHHQTGRVKEIIGSFVVLEDAAWIADSGRWMQAIENGELSEVEPVTVPVRVNLASVIDIYDWKHPLPRTQK